MPTRAARDLVGHFHAITLWLTCPNVDTEPQLSVARPTPGVSSGARIVDIGIHIASPPCDLGPLSRPRSRVKPWGLMALARLACRCDPGLARRPPRRSS